jgi:hypothetical protein
MEGLTKIILFFNMLNFLKAHSQIKKFAKENEVSF